MLVIREYAIMRLLSTDKGWQTPNILTGLPCTHLFIFTSLCLPNFLKMTVCSIKIMQLLDSAKYIKFWNGKCQ